MEQEQLYSIALTQLSYISLANLHELYQRFGSAAEIMENRKNLRDIEPDISPRLEKALSDIDEALHKAQVELEWAETQGIEVIPLNSSSYPQRLKDCPDAPIVLFYKGVADLNYKKIISIVGTRHATPYGRDLLHHFMQDLRMMSDVLVVSGLAYGVDVVAHREALEQGFPTIAVLAHGLDVLYPNMHKREAEQMLSNGGLITEYVSHTRIAKSNFVQRNRIVAGLADCTIVVESAEKGGGLITIGIARDYDRDTFAFPGAVNAEYSKGCNNLIRDNKAMLISNAADLVAAMKWDDEQQLSKAREEGIARRLFDDLSEPERKLVELLQKTNDLQVNILTVQSGLPFNEVTALLFNLEMKGVVRSRAGGTYHLL